MKPNSWQVLEEINEEWFPSITKNNIRCLLLLRLQDNLADPSTLKEVPSYCLMVVLVLTIFEKVLVYQVFFQT